MSTAGTSTVGIARARVGVARTGLDFPADVGRWRDVRRERLGTP